jgi:hypothetical protein
MRFPFSKAEHMVRTATNLGQPRLSYLLALNYGVSLLLEWWMLIQVKMHLLRILTQWSIIIHKCSTAI